MRVRLILLMSCLSGSVQAAIDNSVLDCGASGVTYFPRGDHWPAQWDAVGILPVLFRQQRDGAPSISNNADLDAVSTAFITWMNHRCAGNLSPDILVEDSHNDYENRDRGDVWSCATGGACNEECTGGCKLDDAQSIIYFVTQNWEGIADSKTVALTTTLSIPDTGFTVDADMEFNAENFGWRVGASGCTAGAANCFDIESVALHEAGHFIGFNHVMCTDAVMFPEGSGTNVRTALSEHERAGLCAVYPPRDASLTDPNDRDTGEQCAATSQCPAGHTCIKPTGYSADSMWGWCAATCSTTSQCPTAFICATSSAGERFCRPGPHMTGGGDDNGDGVSDVVDPSTGESRDLCAPCSEGSQCASGICVRDDSGDGLCSRTCFTELLSNGEVGASAPCPSGMDCVVADDGWSVCWPPDPALCGSSEYRGMLNEPCYNENTSTQPDDDWFRSCGPGLICFVFKARCEGQAGNCVQYCNQTDSPCRDDNMTCCNRVDDYGACVGVDSQAVHGGCFDIRRIGESCVQPEQSVCEDGAGCFFFEASSLAKCYEMCGSCSAGDTCVNFSDNCSNTFSVCCGSDDWESAQACLPSEDPTMYDVGVACRVNDDCDSGKCLEIDDDAACSRWCDPVTAVGCPGNIDVNGDGATDGGFACRTIDGEGWCWPRRGPVDPPGLEEVESSGCCSAVAAKPGDWFLNALLFLPALIRRRHRRRCANSR